MKLKYILHDACSYLTHILSVITLCSHSPPALSSSGISYSSYDSTGYTSTSTPSYYQPAQQTLTQPQPPPHQPQQPPKPQPPKQLTSSSWSNSGSNMVTAPAGNTYKKPTFHQNKLQKPKGPPKQPQLHYCDICKISCAGPQVRVFNDKTLFIRSFQQICLSCGALQS